MPKKFQGMNTKAMDARARKSAASAAAQEAKQKAAEDEYWKDNDKHVNKKLQRKQAQEQKRLSNLNKKKELNELYQTEQETIKTISKPSSSTSKKVTRAEIDKSKQKEQLQKSLQSEEEKLKQKNISVQDDLVTENANQVVASSLSAGDVEARTVEEAISALSTSDELDKHPERRMKAAFKKYEEEQLPLLKIENPGMRKSQLKQLLFKQWQKSPENPFNQQHSSYNAK